MSDPILSPSESQPPRPTVRRLFIGDDGLRAGWSVLLYLLLAIAFGLLAAAAVRYGHLLHIPAKGEAIVMTPRFAATQELLSIFTFVLPGVLMALIERRPFSCYGFAPRRALSDLLQGLFWGVLTLSLLVLLLYLVHGLGFDGIALRGLPALTYGLEWFGAFALVGFFEEFFFRGYLQFTVSRGVAGITRAMDPNNRHTYAIGFWVAAFLFSILLFSLTHLSNGGENVAGIIAVALAGITLVFSLWRTGALWWAIGWHTAWDWAQSCLFGTPDSGNVSRYHILSTHPIGAALLSGGSDGPEGSLLVVPVLLLTMLIIAFTLPYRPRPLTPDQSTPESASDAG